MNQEIRGNSGQITQTGNVIVCHGGTECPMRMNAVPPSANEEEAFCRATGLRVSPRVRELLEQFRETHNLTWRGSKSIARMWRHRTLEYDDARDRLRLNPSLFQLVVGWIYFLMSSLFVMGLAVMPIFGEFKGSVLDAIIFGGFFFGAMFGTWVSIEHVVMPELLARRLLKKSSRNRATTTPAVAQ